MAAFGSGSNFLKRDWWPGLAISVLVLVFSASDLLQSLERKAYDLGMMAAQRQPAEQVAVIAIDDYSIANLGRWPWSRELHARMADLLTAGQAKLIGNTVFFSEAETSPGLAYIVRLRQMLAPAEGETAPAAFEPALALLQEAEQTLNTDQRLAASYAAAGKVLLPLAFRLGEPRGRPEKPLPDYLTRNRLQQVGASEGGEALAADSVLAPLAGIGETALALGHLTSGLDVDGALRSEPLVLRYYEDYYPSLALMLAAKSLNLQAGDIAVNLGETVRLGGLRIATDAQTRMYPFFYRSNAERPAFPVDSFSDVLSGKIPAGKYAGKIVLIGATATGVGSPQLTPVGSLAPVMVLAHTLSSILQEHFFVRPGWGGAVQWGAFLLVAFYLILLLPRLSAGGGALLTLFLLAALLGGHFGLMLLAGIWVPLMTALSLLLLGHLLLTTKRFLLTERGKEKSELESAESNRMLALAFQGQGQLDMAFDKFRKCPMDGGLMENLYNLALDYERKRQFNKAEAVYRTMAEHELNFRDLPQRLARAKQMSETVLLGGAAGQTVGGTVILGDGQIEKPMLGRYQVEKELGKGAMGVVYLGRDPKINRVVAIKTMALAQEFDADELADVKARFFREAETAGRLNHPHIVTMYDAGEEHDLAYIAMEFLKGKDLVPQTKAGALLPLPRVLSIVARVADALDYAHQNNVVHRDIKPANIMYEPESDQVKVTDFGIARITDSSRTKTGMVLGTPSYMSPEQLAGKKIDGRSDLFSLGVTLYQLCSGHLPFVGESMAQLMFKITNEAPAEITAYVPELPACVVSVIAKSLQKDMAQRYQRGAEMAADLRQCLQGLSAGQSGV